MRDWINLLENYIGYHGTNQPFTAFSFHRAAMSTGKGGGAEHAFFFTDDPEEAAAYALHAGNTVVSNVDQFEEDSARLKKEVDRLERQAHRTGDWEPYEKAMSEWENLEIGATREDPMIGHRVIKADLDIQNPYEIDFHGQTLISVYDLDQQVIKAKADGHDGVILYNVNDSPKGGFISTHYAVFSPEQIHILS
jgi:hypothetical protein